MLTSSFNDIFTWYSTVKTFFKLILFVEGNDISKDK